MGSSTKAIDLLQPLGTLSSNTGGVDQPKGGGSTPGVENPRKEENNDKSMITDQVNRNKINEKEKTVSIQVVPLGAMVEREQASPPAPTIPVRKTQL